MPTRLGDVRGGASQYDSWCVRNQAKIDQGSVSMSSVLQQISDDLAAIVEAVSASTVRIEARRRLPATGMVWSADGLIVTTHHVIRTPDRIQVGLANGEMAPARLVGRDPSTDLAVLQIDGMTLTPTPWAPADQLDLKVGQLALALGRPGEATQAALGLINALGEAWRAPTGARIDQYVQTDVVMYPGFSGGPLVDASGRVVGVNTSALLRNVSLTLPVATLRRVVAMLVDHGRVRRGFLGLSTQPVRLPEEVANQMGQETGLILTAVETGSPAEQGGLLLGDTLITLDGVAMRQPDDLIAFLVPDKIGAAVAVKLLRGGEVLEVEVTVGERA